MTDDLLRYRPEFPILERTTYLISNSLGAMPRGVYDALHRADLVEHLLTTGERHDLVVAADVFIYVGDLAPVFEGVARVLRPGGLFAFSVEPAPADAGFVLQPSLRYAHGEGAIRALAARHGQAVQDIEPRHLAVDQGAVGIEQDGVEAHGGRVSVSPWRAAIRAWRKRGSAASPVP